MPDHESTARQEGDDQSDDRYVLFDLEWIPHPEIVEQLEFVYRADRTPDEQLGLPGEVVSMSEKGLKAYLANCLPSESWLCRAIDAESMLKNRSGVTEFLSAELKKCQSGNVPDTALQLAEVQQILCMGYSIGYGEIEVIWGEAECVKRFNELTRLYVPAGWAIETFDLPVMLFAGARSGALLGRNYDLRRGIGYLDVHKVRFGRHFGSLVNVSTALGFDAGNRDPLKNGGADVLQAFLEERNDDIMAHCRVDIERLQHVMKKYRGYFF
ncbi:MAG: hypothetical protein ACKO0Z_25490 [Betaproteobacteria bacterium]